MPSDASFVDEAAYNQLFNMFGTMMMFLLAVPIGQAFAMKLLPILIETCDMPFPWLPPFGFRCGATGGVLVCSISSTES
jgi:heme/copper-type cytochrome/quinol oxidase subunit 1